MYTGVQPVQISKGPISSYDYIDNASIGPPLYITVI
jgi:hypothetical protein